MGDQASSDRFRSGDVPADVAELIVVRHGETISNADGRLQGQSESELNDVGLNQADAIAERLARGDLPFTAIYSSDLKRAMDTAKVIAGKTGCEKVLPHAGLRERCLGVLQGLLRKEVETSHPAAFRALISKSWNEAIPGGGESRGQLSNRVLEAGEEIAKSHYGERVVIVTHGGVLNCFHYNATGRNASGKAVNAAINIFQIDRKGTWKLVRWGDIEHLEKVGWLASGFGGGRDSA